MLDLNGLDDGGSNLPVGDALLVTSSIPVPRASARVGESLTTRAQGTVV